MTHRKKVIWTAVLLFLMLIIVVPTIFGDLMSINNGFSTGSVMTPNGDIEGFFFTRALIDDAWKIAIMTAMMGVTGLFVYIGKNTDDKHEPVRLMLYLSAFLFTTIIVYLGVMMMVQVDAGILEMMNVVFMGVMFTFITVTAIWIIQFLMHAMNLARANIR